MRTAVVTFTYNEAFNLPIWIKHYGANFGEEHLYIVDRGSDDDSLDTVGRANVVPVPRKKFDEFEKTEFISLFQNALLKFYDAVIITDADELLIADPDRYGSLAEYVERAEFEHINAIGLEPIHLIDAEMPIDVDKPILSQRRIARLQSPSCKKLLSKVPLKWLPGFHSCDAPPVFDGHLFMIHTKVIDYAVSMRRQKINQDTDWSERSQQAVPQTHHKYTFETFIHQNYLTTLDLLKRGQFTDLDIPAFLADFSARVSQRDGFYYIPMDIRQLVTIPDRLKSCV